MKQIILLLAVFLIISCKSAPLSDDALLDLIQKQTFKYFWDFADPSTKLARERSNITTYGHEVLTTGGSGFGIMSIIVGVERGFIQRDTAVKHLLSLTNALDSKIERFHGAYSHWVNGITGKAFHFSEKDNGADIVETAYLIMGLLTANQYFNNENPLESELRQSINDIWKSVEWNWFTQDGQNQLYWHWSPDFGWDMNHTIRGWDECLITYILAASSPTYPIDSEVYHEGWTNSDHFVNGKEYYNIKLPLGFDYGGPLFFSHYTFLGLDPRGLKDKYADYWEQNVAHTQINRAYCIENPNNWEGYGENCWGLTASDNRKGYGAQSPTNDNGTISPTAALSAFPYTPEYSMQALRHFYYDLGDKLWGEYGFKDAFNLSENWFAESYLAIDQGPIIVMIENYRSQLLWKLFMSHPDVQNGLKRLGFRSPHLKN
jgi:hypothetical protein